MSAHLAYILHTSSAPRYKHVEGRSVASYATFTQLKSQQHVHNRCTKDRFCSFCCVVAGLKSVVLEPTKSMQFAKLSHQPARLHCSDSTDFIIYIHSGLCIRPLVTLSRACPLGLVRAKCTLAWSKLAFQQLVPILCSATLSRSRVAHT
jgi:hypothetical protein